MNLQENITRIKKMMGIHEEMKIDDWGRLHDEENKIVYPYKKISKLIDWFESEFGDYAKQQGWSIFSSDTDIPKIKYKPGIFGLNFAFQKMWCVTAGIEVNC